MPLLPVVPPRAGQADLLCCAVTLCAPRVLRCAVQARSVKKRAAMAQRALGIKGKMFAKERAKEKVRLCDWEWGLLRHVNSCRPKGWLFSAVIAGQQERLQHTPSCAPPRGIAQSLQATMRQTAAMHEGHALFLVL